MKTFIIILCYLAFINFLTVKTRNEINSEENAVEIMRNMGKSAFLKLNETLINAKLQAKMY